MTRTLKKIESDIKRHLKHEDGQIPTDNIKSVANAVLEARTEHFVNQDGEPDYRGSTWQYRRWFGDLVRSAELPEDTQRKVMASVRYHAGNALRTTVAPEALADAGLKTVSPRERSLALRHESAKVVSLFGAGARIEDPDDALIALEAFKRFARRTDWTSLKEDPRIKAGLAEIRKLIK